MDTINDSRSLKYVKEEKAESNIADLQLEDEYDPTWYQKLVADAKLFMKSLFEAIPINKADGWKKLTRYYAFNCYYKLSWSSFYFIVKCILYNACWWKYCNE